MQTCRIEARAHKTLCKLVEPKTWIPHGRDGAKQGSGAGRGNAERLGWAGRGEASQKHHGTLCPGPPEHRNQPSWTLIRRGGENIYNTCRIQNPDIPRAGRVRAAHGGAAGRDRAEQDGAPTDRFAQEVTFPRTSQGIVRTCPDRLFRRQTSEILCKPMVERKPRLASG